MIRGRVAVALTIALTACGPAARIVDAGPLEGRDAGRVDASVPDGGRGNPPVLATGDRGTIMHGMLY